MLLLGLLGQIEKSARSRTREISPPCHPGQTKCEPGSSKNKVGNSGGELNVY